MLLAIVAEPEELLTKAQKSEIILQYGKLSSATSVRRWFRNHYPNIPNSRICLAHSLEEAKAPSLQSAS